MYRRVVNFLKSAAAAACAMMAKSSAPPENNVGPQIRHVTASQTTRKQWRKLVRPRGGRVYSIVSKHPPLHEQPDWLEHCARRVYRWFKHHDPANGRPPAHITRMMDSIIRASGRGHLERLLAHAVRFRSYRH